ncbi:unnamed protein product, partial [Ectocarpus sp. 12 AP-2014]
LHPQGFHGLGAGGDNDAIGFGVFRVSVGEREPPGAAGSRARLDLGPAVLQRAPQPRVHGGRLPPATGETTAPGARVLPLSAGPGRSSDELHE